MVYTNNREVQELIDQFDKKTLPKSNWTHAAHLTVGLYHVYHGTFHEAHCLVKSKIITYNEATGTANTPSSGYHETLTVFWLTIINKFLELLNKEKMFVPQRIWLTGKAEMLLNNSGFSLKD